MVSQIVNHVLLRHCFTIFT